MEDLARGHVACNIFRGETNKEKEAGAYTLCQNCAHGAGLRWSRTCTSGRSGELHKRKAVGREQGQYISTIWVDPDGLRTLGRTDGAEG